MDTPESSSASSANPETISHTPVLLRDLLLDAYKSSKLAPQAVPFSIDLGLIGKEAEKLMDLTSQDPEQREHTQGIFLDTRGQMFTDSPMRGEKDRVQIRKYNGKKRIAGIHSHGDEDTPYSPTDVRHLVTNPQDIDDLTIPVSIVVTPTQKLLLMRTEASPLLPNVEAITETEFSQLLSDLKEGGIHLPGNTILQRSLSATSHHRMNVMLEIFRNLHLQLYSCSLDKNIAVKAY
jgi:hypothetical protein